MGFRKCENVFTHALRSGNMILLREYISIFFSPACIKCILFHSIIFILLIYKFDWTKQFHVPCISLSKTMYFPLNNIVFPLFEIIKIERVGHVGKDNSIDVPKY